MKGDVRETLQQVQDIQMETLDTVLHSPASESKSAAWAETSNVTKIHKDKQNLHRQGSMKRIRQRVKKFFRRSKKSDESIYDGSDANQSQEHPDFNGGEESTIDDQSLSSALTSLEAIVRKGQLLAAELAQETKSVISYSPPDYEDCKGNTNGWMHAMNELEESVNAIKLDGCRIEIPDDAAGTKRSVLTVVAEVGAGAYGYVLKVIDSNQNITALKVVPAFEAPYDPADKYTGNASDKSTKREILFNNYNKLSKDAHPNLVATRATWSQITTKQEYLTWRKEMCKNIGQHKKDLITRSIKDAPAEDLRITMNFIQMDFYPSGNLGQWLAKQMGNFKSTYTQRVLFIHGITSGLDFLHEKNLMHRDLDPKNVLIHKDGDFFVARIADFGCLITCGTGAEYRLTKTRARYTNNIGKAYYAAPETMGTQYDQTCDLYSLGVIILRMMWNICSGPQLQDAIFSCQEGERPALVHELISKENWLRIVQQQVSPKGNKRMACKDLLQQIPTATTEWCI